jgi:hypothetical protein
VILFTDGETAPYLTGELRQALEQRPRMSFDVIHVWHSNERIYTSHGVDPNYRSDPQSSVDLNELSNLSGARVFDEHHIGQAIGAARQLVGKGPTARVGEGLHIVALARWLALASLVPFALVLFWRNTG